MNAVTLVSTHPRIILFDGVCKLCAAWVSFVVARDRQQKFKFASVQSAEGQALLAWCGLPTDRFDTMVYIENGRPCFQSTAFLQVIKHFGSGWRLLSLGRTTPRQPRDWLYNRIALNRYRLFGKREVCLVPTAELSARFLGGV